MKGLESFLFRPSDRIRHIIRLGAKYPSRNFESHTIIQPKGDLPPFISGLTQQIADFYRFALDESELKCASQRVHSVAYEAIKNGIIHGAKCRHPIIFGLFMGDDGVCYGFRDFGKYFKDADIKKRWENKESVTEFSPSAPLGEDMSFGSGASAGVNGLIFPYSDIIEVDNEKGVLYCVQMRENLVKPIE